MTQRPDQIRSQHPGVSNSQHSENALRDVGGRPGLSFPLSSASLLRPSIDPDKTSHDIFCPENLPRNVGKANYPFFCTRCSHYRPFKNLSDWKRHEREHETTYICMLGGVVEWSAIRESFVCIICGSPDRNEEHFKAHNVNPCARQAPESYSNTRRDKMVNHLSIQHKVHDRNQAQAIADKWRFKSGKQVWSCGFCVMIFTDFEDRLTHVSIQHFQNHQERSEWTATNVIRGLLRQPGVAAAWERIMINAYGWDCPDIAWVNGTIDELQDKLEKGQSSSQSAESLAGAAYVASRFWDGHELVEPALSVTNFNGAAQYQPVALPVTSFGFSETSLTSSMKEDTQLKTCL